MIEVLILNHPKTLPTGYSSRSREEYPPHISVDVDQNPPHGIVGIMESKFLSDLSSLSLAQKTVLAKGRLQTVANLLLATPTVLAQKCRVPIKEMEGIIDLVCRELAPQSRPLREVAHIGEEKFTTGDSHLDAVLGGGSRTGMLWRYLERTMQGKPSSLCSCL
ncbi:hypothetical protein BD414DRAFT_281935 [Trametes punicea]|nr:hypothetical protein BD414DRAFT_281935 [Trametes punicea]